MQSSLDGSRDEQRRVGCAAVWRDSEGSDGWKERKVHLGCNKEVYDAELYGIAEALKIAKRRRLWESVMQRHSGPALDPPTIRVFTDAQAALTRMKTNPPTAGQWLVTRIIKSEQEILALGVRVEYHWVPGHEGIEGKNALTRPQRRRPLTPRAPEFDNFLRQRSSLPSPICPDEPLNASGRKPMTGSAHTRNRDPPTS